MEVIYILKTCGPADALHTAIEAIESVPSGTDLILHTDNHYLRLMVSEYLAAHAANNYRTHTGKKVKHFKRLRRLNHLLTTRNVTWKWSF